MGSALGRQRRLLSALEAGVEETYRFPLAEHIAWLEHLRSCGYVVVGQALSVEEVAIAHDFLWQDLEAAAPQGESLSQNDVSSWRQWKLHSTGLTTSVTQGAGAWHVRGCAGVRRAFGNIWDTSDLIVSMDCVIAWRPWWIEPSWKPCTEGLHLDQNPFSKPKLECVQGMVPLLPVEPATGGLQVIPFSHTEEAKDAQKINYPHLKQRGDWCPLFCDDAGALLLRARPGDLILWDSRTIHGGRVGTGTIPAVSTSSGASGHERVELARLAVAVAMTPRAWASEEVQKARVKGFESGLNFNHSPHESGTSTGTLGCETRLGYKPIELTAAQRALL